MLTTFGPAKIDRMGVISEPDASLWVARWYAGIAVAVAERLNG